MRRTLTTLLSLILTVSLSGCLGTFVDTSAPTGQSISSTHIHILAAPIGMDAQICSHGMASVSTYVPPWGIVVGILTFGIIVPKTLSYTCVGDR